MIREATLDDLPAITALVERFVTQDQFRGLMPFNPEQVTTTTTWLITQAEGALWVAVDDSGTVVGMLGAVLSVHPLSGECQASELGWWVNPEARQGGRHGLGLLRAAEAWALAHGAVAINMMAPNIRVAKLYAARQYRLLEVTYQRRWTDAVSA